MRGFYLFLLLLVACIPVTDLPAVSFSPSPSVTPTLSPYPTFALTSQITETPSPSPSPIVRTFSGRAKTRINVRKAPSISAEVLGVLDAGTPVEILTQDTSHSWFLIVYPGGDGRGWVSAAYIEGVDPAAIPVLNEPLALVLQPLNVRSGPGTNFESLGMLKAGDLVKALGKDEFGAWIQIEYPAAPQGKGWVNAAFIRLEEVDQLPVLSPEGNLIRTAGSAVPTASVTPTLRPALLDGDTQAAPLWKVVFDRIPPYRVILEDEISFPHGDAEDWVRVETDHPINLQVSLRCDSPNALRVERWDDQEHSQTLPLSCDSQVFLSANPTFWLRILEVSTGNELHFMRYRLELRWVE